MYTDICRVITDMLPEHSDQPTFSQLLGKMGIDAGHQRLFDLSNINMAKTILLVHGTAR
jgi:hypothetical protein